jgi:hypothetical protein
MGDELDEHRALRVALEVTADVHTAEVGRPSPSPRRRAAF